MRVEKMRYLRGFVRVIASFIIAGGLTGALPTRADAIMVFAAASLKNAIDDDITEWKSGGGGPVTASYASSSVLAKQIEQAAPADIFISADTQWMDYLAQRRLVVAPRNLLGNRLVLIAGKDDRRMVTIEPNFDLARLLGSGRLAVGDPTNVPVGIYAKEALTKLGVWQSVESKLAPTADVRAALALVSRGEAPLGIVYETDTKIDPGVRIVGILPDDTHSPIVYPVAATTTSTNPDAARFLAFLGSAAAAKIFERYGFKILPH